MPPTFNLKLTNIAGDEVVNRPVLVNDGVPVLTIKTASVEPGAAGEEFRIPIGMVDGGLAADKVRNPRGYTATSGSGIDATWPSFFTLPPKTNGITLSSAVAMASNGEVRMAVEFASNLFIMSGRYIHSVNTSHSVSTSLDLGSGDIGTWMTVVDDNLFVCCGNTDFVQKRTSGGSWSASADVYAQVILPTRRTIWRVRNGTGTIDNSVSGIDANTSTLATAMMTNANWTSPGSSAGYVVGDNSYQVLWGVEYQGGAWFGRADGMFQNDTEGNYFNRTPQLRESPDIGNCLGSAVVFGSLFVPSKNRGLLRVRTGESIAVGPEQIGTPNKSWWVRSMVEHNRAAYLLATDEQGTRQSVLKMVPDDLGISGQEYIFHELQDVVGTNKSPWLQIFQATTNPELFWGGGSATTTATYMRLGRGGGRDIDDSNYQYAAAGELITGNIRPSSGRTMHASLHGVDVYTTMLGTSPSLTVTFNVDDFVGAEPATTMYTNREAATGSSVSTSGRHRFYATTSTSTGSTFNFKFALAQGGTPAGTTRSMVHEAYAFGVLKPFITDYIQVTLDCADGDGVGQNGIRIGKRAREVYRQCKAWQRDAAVLTMKLAEYEEHNTVRVIVVDATEGVKETKEGTNRPKKNTAVTLVLKRMDYAGLYAV